MNEHYKNKEMGRVDVFGGEGKGKTSAALGVVTRMLCNGKGVYWISWYKDASWQPAEARLVKKFPKLLKMVWAGKGFYIKTSSSAPVNGGRVYDFDTPVGHKKAATTALSLAKSVLLGKILPGGKKPNLLVMDEVLNAIGDGLLTEEDVLDVIKNRGKTNVILTGRGMTTRIIENADLVSEIKKIKHPYDVGQLAIKGLDF